MLQIETSRNSELPVLPRRRTGEILLTSAQVLITDVVSGEQEVVTIMSRRIDGRQNLAILRQDEQEPTYLRRDKLAIDGVAIDRGDGQSEFTSADRVRWVEDRLGNGVTRLLVGIRLIEPDTGPPPGPPKRAR